MNGFDSSDAHSALFDANLTMKILGLVKKKQPNTWKNFLSTANRLDTETIFKKEDIITLNEYFYGKSRLYLCAPLHPKYCIQMSLFIKELRKDDVLFTNYSVSGWNTFGYKQISLIIKLS